jgi:hypothetical protein
MTKPEPFDPARLLELSQGITSGPWYNDSEGVWQVEDIDYGKWQVCNCPWPYAEDNAVFIAYCGTHARDIAALGDEVVKLREALEECIYKSDEPTTVELIARQALGDTHDHTN